MWYAKRKEQQRRYFEENKTAIQARRRARRKALKYAGRQNVEGYKENAKKRQQSYRANLHPNYIKRLIRCDNQNIKFEDITDELVRLKQTILLLRRRMKGVTRDEQTEKMLSLIDEYHKRSNDNSV